jgi:hypothetical protein
MPLSTQSPRGGAGYTVSVGQETWSNSRAKTLPDPQGSAVTYVGENGPFVTGNQLNALGIVSVQVPQDDDKAEGARVSATITSICVQKTGEKTRLYYGNITKDGAVTVDPASTDAQVRTIEIACAQRGVIITEVIPAIPEDSPIGTCTFTAAGLKNDGTADTFTWAVATGSALPAGLSISSAGAITGTPSTAGTTTGYLKVTNAAGHVGYVWFSLTVTAVS